MKICVYGLWHLGSVTAACLAAKDLEVIGLDGDIETVTKLKQGQAPLFEPGLNELIEQGLQNRKLSFTTDTKLALRDCDIVWVTFDTPVDQDDNADVQFVKVQVEKIFEYLPPSCIVLISSQMPVGSIASLEGHYSEKYPESTVHFACSPENLRLGAAIQAFNQPSRIVVGIRKQEAKEKLAAPLSKITQNLIWMTVESAEMSKHAINSFLATSITFTNELARICERVGADAKEVESALRSEPRIGNKAYVTPGSAFAGGTLARDIKFLNKLATERKLSLPLLSSVLPSNNEHRLWSVHEVENFYKSLKGKRIAVLGLAYKAGTSATRRSLGVEFCELLVQKGASVNAYDPEVKQLPESIEGNVNLSQSVLKAVEQADALIVATEWPEFKELSSDSIIEKMIKPLIIDQTKFLASLFADKLKDNYRYVGFKNDPKK